MTGSNPDSPAFHLPKGVRYECRQDADCCRDFWEIRVEAAAAENILEADWRSCSRLDAKEETPFSASKTDPDTLLLKHVAKECCFLGEKGLCGLHARYGYDLKPAICKRFPFHFAEAPDGVYVGLSFACPTVLKNLGSDVETYREDLREIYACQASVESVSAPVRFDASTPVEWGEYLEIESALGEILARAEETFETCLIAGHVWLGMLAKMLEPIRKGDSEKTVAETLQFYIERTRAEGYARAFSLAHRPVAHPTLKRMLLGSFISFRGTLSPGQWRLVGIARILFQNIRHWARFGSLRMPPIEEPVPYREFHPDPAELASPGIQALLRRYFQHALFRKDLILHTDLFWGYCYFILTYGLIQWYAETLRQTGRSDATEAVSLVEKYYVHHSNFSQIFLYHPALADVLNYLFKKPNFAHTIVKG